VRGGGLFALAVSPGGRWLVTANWDGDVQLWHVDSGVELASGYGEWDSVFTLKCSTGGRVIAVADVSRVFVWDFSPEIGAFSNDAKEAPIVLVAAALSSGVGTLLDHEREDFIFRDTPRDLSHILAGMMMAEQRSQVAHAPRGPFERVVPQHRAETPRRGRPFRSPSERCRTGDRLKADRNDRVPVAPAEDRHSRPTAISRWLCMANSKIREHSLPASRSWWDCPVRDLVVPCTAICKFLSISGILARS
jgi:WD40 repeat protein